MADTVSINTIHNSPNTLVVQLNSLSDGTGESNVVKVDKSTFTGLLGAEPSIFRILSIDWMVDGMTVTLKFDRTSDVVICNLAGTGYSDYRKFGGLADTGTGDTGDILLSTVNHSANDSYKILLEIEKVG